MLLYDLAFDVYPPDDPAGKVSGTGVAARLVRLTLDDQLEDGEYLAELFGSGSGFLEIHVDNPDADFLQKRSYVKVIRMTGSLWMAEEEIGGFWLSRGFLKALSGSEQKGRVVRWEGEGPSDGLDRYNLGHSVYATGQIQRGDRTVPGKWAWNDEPMGAMLVRVLEEGFDHPDGFYNFFDWDFTRTEDTNGNDWEVLSDYETPIGTSGLKLWADFLKQGLVAEVSPDLTVHAYRDLDEYRTDRHSATFAAGKVRFEAGVNIAADLLKRLNASSQRTHVLYEDRIGDYETIDEDEDLNPIDGVPYMTYRKSTTTADDNAIRRMGRHFLSTLDRNVDVAKVRHLVGPGGIAGAQGYLPSPTGDYWLGDLVTIHSGTTDYDFNEQTIEVAAIRYFVQGNQWMVEAELGAQYKNIQQQQVAAQIAQTVINQLNSVLLCEADAVIDSDAVSLARLYFSNTGAGLSAITPDSGWENTSGSTGKLMKTTADGSFGATHQSTTSAGGVSGGSDTMLWQGLYGPLSTAEAAAIAAGGLTFRSQIRSRMRYGTGITEAAQDGISNESVRVTAGASTTIRGTALALHTAASSAGSAKWPANATKQNRQGPPAGVATRILSAVPACVAGDYLVIEIGLRNYTTVTSGAAVALTNDSASDLPYDDFTTLPQNSYVDIFDPGTGTLVLGDGGAQFVGTSVKAKRCDDTEHYHATGSASPTVDDDREAGFRVGTFWVNDDGEAWLNIDNSIGEADWLQLATGGGADLSGINFLVGTASGDLSAEIVVGTTPGGELGGTWASPTVDPVHVDANHYQLNKLNGTAAPTSGDDSADGYSVGSRWIDTTNDRVYTCVDSTVGAAVWREGFSDAGGAASISGGTETTTGGFHYCAFTSGGTFTVGVSGYVDLLVVGGGGGGGSYFSGGGGGAGDVVFIPHLYLAAGTYTVVVGAGGAGATLTVAAGNVLGYGVVGAPSKFGSRIFAAGGGAGLPEGSDYIDGSGTSVNNVRSIGGASSGGGGGRNVTVPGTVTGGGNSGGTSRTGGAAGTGAGGGGGGAGAAGASPGASDTGGAGGAGVTISEFSAFGASGVFGGGGGGGGVSVGGNGGTGGGGHGGGTSANTGATDATANTGGGGGGGGNTGTTGAVGKAGGSGVVIVRAAV